MDHLQLELLGVHVDNSFGLLWIPVGFFLMVGMIAGLFLTI